MASASVGHVTLLVLRLVWISVQHVIYWPQYVTWLVLLRPLRWFTPTMYWYIEGLFYSSFITLFSLLSWYNGHKLVEYGQDIEPYRRDRCIVMPNHQSLADVPIIFSALQKYGVFRDFMWVMDRVLMYTHFGFCSYQHGDCFIQQNTGSGREREMQMLAEHIRDVYYPLNRRWVLIFPEGGFLYKRREKSQAYAKRNDLPVLQHTSLPRVGGVQTLVEAMSETQNGIGNGVQYVIDVTIGHPGNETMTLASYMIGTQGVREIHLHYRVFPASQIPTASEDLAKWLYQLYVEKEELLAYFYEHGEFPRENGYIRRGPRDAMDEPCGTFIRLTAFYMSFGILFYYSCYQFYRYLYS